MNWQSVNNNWPQLIRLIEKFHPNGKGHDIKPTPIAAEAVCEMFRNSDILEPVNTANDARNRQDDTLMYQILNETWIGMPESPQVRHEPGFHTLCDLLEDSN